ncbi:hypothetical protein MRB53_017528 [Persea americana]|uniref:Uncharacterized protein n=1 Tax=Persea americana TaxID=3435 RepID=A0ACC2M5E6_PERAE|nr:hypothetical protein MRB53_017528 [Persea americana]
MPTHSNTCSADIISSWLDNDDIYAPTFPEQLQNIHFLDNFPQFSLPDFESDPFSLIAQQEEYSILDHSGSQPHPTGGYNQFLTEIPVTAEPMTHSTNLIEEDESDCFLSDDLCAVLPDESYEKFFDHVMGLGSTPTTIDSCCVNLQMSPLTNDGEGRNEDDEEEEEEETDEDRKPVALNCKNLYSERNRRKRLSQQLLSLRALVPNITKMDKRSVLVDALAYLRSIHEETARIQKELKESPSSVSKFNHNLEPFPNNTTDTVLPSRLFAPPPRRYSKPKSQILEIDTEKIEDRRFVVKITSKGGAGVGGEVLRVIESLGFEITYTALDQIKPMHVLTTVFIRVRKQGRMTEEKLRDCITSTALRSGLILYNP